VTFAKPLLIDDSGIAIEASITFQCTQRPRLEALPSLDFLLSLSSKSVVDKDAMLTCTRDDSVDGRRRSLNKEALNKENPQQVSFLNKDSLLGSQERRR
jgi:hypothetical protein